MKTVYTTNGPAASIEVIRGTQSELGDGHTSSHCYVKHAAIRWGLRINGHIHFCTKTKTEAIKAANWIAESDNDWEAADVEWAWQCSPEGIKFQ